MTKGEIIMVIRNGKFSADDLDEIAKAARAKKRETPEAMALEIKLNSLRFGMKVGFGNKRIHDDYRWGYHEGIVEAVWRTRVDVNVDGRMWHIHASALTILPDQPEIDSGE